MSYDWTLLTRKEQVGGGGCRRLNTPQGTGHPQIPSDVLITIPSQVSTVSLFTRGEVEGRGVTVGRGFPHASPLYRSTNDLLIPAADHVKGNRKLKKCRAGSTL